MEDDEVEESDRMGPGLWSILTSTSPRSILSLGRRTMRQFCYYKLREKRWRRNHWDEMLRNSSVIGLTRNKPEAAKETATTRRANDAN